MTKLGLSTGTTPNDGTGDTLLDGAVKINSNFNELYNRFGDGTNLTAIGGTWAKTSVGIHTLKNVGIGTTNPTSKLTVDGDGKFTGVITALSFSGNISGHATSSSTSGYASTCGISTYSTVAGISSYSIVAGISSYSIVAGISSYSVVSGVSTSVIGGIASISHLSVSGISTINQSLNVGIGGTILITTSNGFVGIGSTNPSSKFTVSGLTSTTDLYVSGSSTISNFTVPSGASIDSTDVILYYLGNQKFATITEGVEISGKQKVASGTYANNGIYLSPVIGEEGYIYHPESTLLSISNYNINGSKISFSVNSVSDLSVTEQVRIISAGVGIGTTNPTSKLTVQGGDISVGVNTSHGIILTSPNGTKYRLIVNNAGALSTVAV